MRVVITDYHVLEDDHKPYRNTFRTADDSIIEYSTVINRLVQEANVLDGDEVEITITKTGNRPFGDRKVILVAPHTYEREPV